MLKTKNTSLQFSRPVLDAINFQLKAGEIVGIVGASGGGKSSFLKIIAGLFDASSGEILFRGKKIKGPSEQLIPGHTEIQLVNQDFGIDLYHTVRENVIQRMLYLPNETRENFTNELLELVELTELAAQQAISLSGGEQQRLAIIRALAVEPEVLLLDEPFAHLDVHLKQKIGAYLKSLAKIRKMASVLVSHEGQDVMEWCSKIYFLNAGKFERIASAREFYLAPTSYFEGRFFGELNEISIDRKKHLFRPNQFQLMNEGIQLTAKSSQFCGFYFRNEYRTKKNEHVILYQNEASEKGNVIFIDLRKN